MHFGLNNRKPVKKILVFSESFGLVVNAFPMNHEFKFQVAVCTNCQKHWSLVTRWVSLRLTCRDIGKVKYWTMPMPLLKIAFPMRIWGQKDSFFQIKCLLELACIFCNSANEDPLQKPNSSLLHPNLFSSCALFQKSEMFISFWYPIHGKVNSNQWKNPLLNVDISTSVNNIHSCKAAIYKLFWSH